MVSELCGRIPRIGLTFLGKPIGQANILMHLGSNKFKQMGFVSCGKPNNNPSQKRFLIWYSPSWGDFAFTRNLPHKWLVNIGEWDGHWAQRRPQLFRSSSVSQVTLLPGPTCTRGFFGRKLPKDHKRQSMKNIKDKKYQKTSNIAGLKIMKAWEKAMSNKQNHLEMPNF